MAADSPMYRELQTHTTRYIRNMLYIPVLYAIIPRATAAASTVSNVEVPGPGVNGTGEKICLSAHEAEERVEKRLDASRLLRHAD